MEHQNPGPSRIRLISKLELFEIAQRQDLSSFDEKLSFMENYLITLDDFSTEQQTDIKKRFSRVKSTFKTKWVQANRTEQVFKIKNKDWLDSMFSLPQISTSIRPGRPQKKFENLSERRKRVLTSELRAKTDLQVLTHATQSKLQTEGKRIAASVLKDLVSTPKRAKTYRSAFNKNEDTCGEMLTPLAALCMFVEANMTRKQYDIVRSTSKSRFPCYSVLQRAKLECYPPSDSFIITETTAEIKLQSLIDHTVSRLFLYLEDVLQCCSENELRNLMIFCKWGCDGSQQVQYKQKFQNDSASDSNIFLSSFVPLQVKCTTNEKIIWQNSTPSSPRFCRPIRMRFLKETADLTREEIDYISNAVNQLEPTNVTFNEKVYPIKHKLMLTMVDGKVCNAATHTTSTMRCYICGSTSKDFNDLNKPFPEKEGTLEFGLSTLHARIRLFESILHLSYNLPLKKWQIRTEEDKAVVKERKKEIKAKFRSKLGLIVDTPKVGAGNTNDGNTSRRFFADVEVAAEITGIAETLIHRFKVLLEAISSGHKILLEKFKEFAFETAKLYVDLYPWYPMTPTMHKILLHGGVIIEKALLPIGQLSEEAAEARNKHFRLYRQNFARKFSRVECNKDIINRLLLTSDPLISSNRPIPKKTTKPFLAETLALLVPALPSTGDSILAVEHEPESRMDRDESGTDIDGITSDEEGWTVSSSM